MWQTIYLLEIVVKFYANIIQDILYLVILDFNTKHCVIKTKFLRNYIFEHFEAMIA